MKLLSLVKASMSEGMNIFKINTKKSTKFTRVGLPIIIAIILMLSMMTYSDQLILTLKPINMEFVLLTIFIVMTSVITFLEGIYKSGSLVFNCKDDNLLFSLPIKKSTVLFIRLLKFYIFELIYNSIFLIPSFIVYAIYTKPDFSFYLVTLISLFLFPIIPIVISSIIGFITSLVSSKFRGKNIIETILSFILMFAIMFISYGSDGLVIKIAQNASSINKKITRIYYPAGAYLELITEFNVIKLLEFIGINLAIFACLTFISGKFYFKINSSVKAVKTKKSTKTCNFKVKSQTHSLVKKELNRFINSPVFITNAAFGLILFIIGCVYVSVKVDDTFYKSIPLLKGNIMDKIMPLLLFAFISFSSFMTSITSSMISLEGSSLNILKSLPVKPYTIVKSKVLTAVMIMIPVLLVGSTIIFIKFRFSLVYIILITIACIILPLISETIGIIVNLKYPKMDAKNDTEVVKQSMSSAISVFTGMLLTGGTIYMLYKSLRWGLSTGLILLIFVVAFLIIYVALEMYLVKRCEKDFNNIVV